jgi:hypothetical protein
MNVVRRRNTVWKSIRDYIVPIVGVLLIILLIFSLFSWNEEEEKNIDLENKVWLSLNLNWANTEWYIVYPWDYKKKIEWDISLYKWEKIIVKNWWIDLSLLWLWDFKLNKLWELKYDESGSFSLYSSDVWLNSASKIDFNLRFAFVKVWENTSISFSQNEMWSIIYLMKWFAEVENLAWVTTVLAPWQKITVSRLNANKNDINLSLAKEVIDDYYKQSDWFIKNNGSNYLQANWVIDSSEPDTTWSVKEPKTSSSKLITLNNISDEVNVSSDNLTISWNFVDEEITKITLNGVEAAINKKAKTFQFKNVSVANSENDLVFKVYDDANDVLSRFVYTVFYDWAVVSNKTSKFNVQTFDVDWSKFTFTSPSSKSTYSTYEEFLTIRWKVLTDWISSVTVNGYKLKSFNGSTWRYHASILNNNLSIWTNVYEVKYLDSSWKLLYSNHYTIIRKDPKTRKEEVKVVVPVVKEEVKKVEPIIEEKKDTEVYSNEAKIN